MTKCVRWFVYLSLVLGFYSIVAQDRLYAQGVSFQPAVQYNLGNINLAGIAVGDFNRDSRQDLGVTSWGLSDGENYAWILLGNGDGTFQPANNFPTGTGSFSVAIGDFNGDGIPDLALTNIYSNDVSVLLGNGDGTFQPAVSYSAGYFARFVLVGDFRGTGKLDLAVANSGNGADDPGSISVLLGNGDGTFEPAMNFRAGGSPHGLAVGDFNKDGKLDLAVANTDTNDVSVLLGNGDGTFQAAVNYAAGTGPLAAAVGDFNEDGNLDLAVVNSFSWDVSVLLGSGDGTFAAAATYPAGGARPQSIAVADFNNDRHVDLVLANDESDNISVLLGNGDGTFRDAVTFAVGSCPYTCQPKTLAVGDFNGDGLPDVAVANLTSGVSVLINNTP